MLAHISSTVIDLIQVYGYVGVFVLMTLESALIPIPSEVTMPFAGFLVTKGVFSLWTVILVGAFANLVGSLIGYYIGYLFSEEALVRWINKYGKFLLLSEHEYRKSHDWFVRKGSGVAFLSRLIPGVRTFISLPAGIFKMNIWKFSIYTFIGSLIWSALLTYVGFYLGTQWDSLESVFQKFHVLIIAVAIICVGYFIYHQVQKKKTN